MLIAKAEPPGLLRVASWIGRRMDVHCTGVGKALIAFLPEEELDYLIREHGLPRHNEKTNTSSRRLREEFSKVRRLGYAFDDEEDEIGLRCIGAPVFGQAGKVVASVKLKSLPNAYWEISSVENSMLRLSIHCCFSSFVSFTVAPSRVAQP